MIAFCSKCGQLVRGSATADVNLTDEQKAATRIKDFDSLAGAMMIHIDQRHARREDFAASPCEQLSAIMHLAGKVYAMSLARSTDQEFGELRDAWNHAIHAALFPQAYPPAEDQIGSGTPLAADSAETS